MYKDLGESHNTLVGRCRYFNFLKEVRAVICFVSTLYLILL